MKDRFNYITTSYQNIGGHGYGRSPKVVVPFWTGDSHKNFFNAYGDDEFPIMLGSSGKRVEQLKEALRVLGEDISADEDDFGSDTKKALTRLEYPYIIMDEKKFNDIILRAYNYGGKKSGRIVLTEPQMRYLWMKEVSAERRDTLTFDKWLKRQDTKVKIGEGGKKVFNVLFGWLQMKTRGAGNTGGMATQQPVDTSGGLFSKTSDGTIPDGYKLVGGALVLGLSIWGVSVLVKKNREQKVVYVQN